MIHRAITLVVMIAVALLVLLLTLPLATLFSAHSLIALGVMVVISALAGIAFSWRRYRRG